jgi:hypothetical protein
MSPKHDRMRAVDRDLIRGGHYGQRSCEPHAKAEHMAAPTKPAFVKKALANREPSTHGGWSGKDLLVGDGSATIRLNERIGRDTYRYRTEQLGAVNLRDDS